LKVTAACWLLLLAKACSTKIYQMTFSCKCLLVYWVKIGLNGLKTASNNYRKRSWQDWFSTSSWGTKHSTFELSTHFLDKTVIK
jgi:hypothetical protein